MTWFKVDDSLHAHTKAMRAGIEAMGLWVMAGSWSADQLTDGWVPDYAAYRLCPDADRLAEKLVRAGLWDEEEYDGDKGWRFHQWAERQPERADVVADRAGNARKSSLYRDKQLVSAVRARDKDRCRYCGTLVNWKDRRSRSGAMFDYIEDRSLTTLENVVVVCRGCNSRKADRPLSESGMRLLPAGSVGSEHGAVEPSSSTDQALTSVELEGSSSYLDTNQDGTRTDLDQPGSFPVPDPTRPDPTRPGVPTEHLGGVQGGLDFLVTADASTGVEAEFEQWWEQWPRKIAKQAALASYEKARKKKIPAEHLLTAAAQQLAAWRSAGREKDKIPHATTWLNQDRWNDEVERPKFTVITNEESPWSGYRIDASESPWSADMGRSS